MNGVAAGALVSGLISSLRVLGLVTAAQCIMFFFFNMIILLLVFIVLSSVCPCLALNQEQLGQLPEEGWNNTVRAQNDILGNLNCCGF